ncbi:MAG: carbohydrate ABC transporter permease, partial [Anaeroplasmataceae bacterium]|nr:carbohydrate ABC transporter permease [Anaeroplasmataceae bacterium]
YMLNTIIFSVTTTLLMVFVSLLAAFAFARLDFKGKNVVFVIFLAMMMVPNELVIITNYVSIVNLDWRNTFTGLILPSVLSVFYIYLLRQNFMQVSDDVYFAAKVDGTSDFKYLWKILVPLSKPTIITITILKLIECWNSYVWPRLITTDKDFYLVSNGIQLIKEQSMGKADIPGMMAAVVCVSLPLLLLFIAFRKQIMSGVARSGSKG